MSKDKEFWQQQIRVLQMTIDALVQEQDHKDKMIEMDYHLIEFCKRRLKDLA
jgi:hypothetical protein